MIARDSDPWKSRFRPRSPCGPISARVIKRLEAFQNIALQSRPTTAGQHLVCYHLSSSSRLPSKSSSDLLSLPSVLHPTHAIMLSRSTFSRNAPRALQKQCAASRRGMASATTPGLQYEVSDAAGVKVANREIGGPTGTLALVAKAGSRYQPFPGFSEALDQFAFQVGPQGPMAVFCASIHIWNGLEIDVFGLQLIVYAEAVGIADHSGG